MPAATRLRVSCQRRARRLVKAEFGDRIRREPCIAIFTNRKAIF